MGLGKRHAASLNKAVMPAQAGIQYIAASRFSHNCRGVLDRPPPRMMTGEIEASRLPTLRHCERSEAIQNPARHPGLLRCARNDAVFRQPLVMPGVVPGIHVDRRWDSWMAGPTPRRRGFGPAGGSSPAMTEEREGHSLIGPTNAPLTPPTSPCRPGSRARSSRSSAACPDASRRSRTARRSRR
jgi:hypothetical protein